MSLLAQNNCGKTYTGIYWSAVYIMLELFGSAMAGTYHVNSNQGYQRRSYGYQANNRIVYAAGGSYGSSNYAGSDSSDSSSGVDGMLALYIFLGVLGFGIFVYLIQVYCKKCAENPSRRSQATPSGGPKKVHVNTIATAHKIAKKAIDDIDFEADVEHVDVEPVPSYEPNPGFEPMQPYPVLEQMQQQAAYDPGYYEQCM